MADDVMLRSVVYYTVCDTASARRNPRDDFAANQVLSQIVTVPIAEYVSWWRALETRPASPQFGPILALNRRYQSPACTEYNMMRVVKHCQ